MNPCDVIVIGAGPAGAGTALLLARRGWDVRLYERAALPREKACGGCLHRRGVARLQHWGLKHVLGAAGAQGLDGVEVWTPTSRMVWPRRHGVVVDRTAFDHALVQAAAEAGAEVLERSAARVVGRDTERSGWVVRTPHRNEAARIVVVADGVGGSALSGLDGFSIRRRAGSYVGMSAALERCGLDLRNGRVRMHCAGGGYVGLVRNGGGALEAAAALSPGLLRSSGGAAGAVAAVLESCGQAMLATRAREAHWRVTAPLTVSRRRVATPGLFVVGDSAGYVEPFTGEGMAWALEAADRSAGLVEAILTGRMTASAAARRWTRWIRWQRGVGRLRCRALARLLRHSAALSAVVGALSRWPACRPDGDGLRSGALA